jgi:3-phenylpropionate/cinnamic acid dioxygenase small subunit
MGDEKRAHSVGNDTYIDILRFLFREADILDRREYREWLGLLADDISYRVSAQINRDAMSGRLEYAIIDENAARLKARVEQIANPKLTHAENPPTLTRRFVSNLQAGPGTTPDEYVATSNLLIYRTRPELPDGALYVGERTDVLRRVGGDLKLAQRNVRLDQSILQGNVSTLF